LTYLMVMVDKSQINRCSRRSRRGTQAICQIPNQLEVVFAAIQPYSTDAVL